MIPVMAVGALLFGVQYGLRDYACAALIAGGIGAFAMLDPDRRARCLEN